MNESLRDIWNDRETFAGNDMQIHVVSKGGLIKMKEMAGRDQDLLDIQKLSEDEGDDAQS